MTAQPTTPPTPTAFAPVECPPWEPGTLVTSAEFLEPRVRATGHAPVRVVQWNIERGYELAGIVAELAALDADVLLLQELDIGCDRSRGVDCLTELARALHMAYAFAPEFRELRSPLRAPRDQGGGVHGNAVLARFPLREPRVLVHRVQPVCWAAEGAARREPRVGARCAVTALVDVPGAPQPLRVYSCHLEVFCDIAGRVGQFADILDDAAHCCAATAGPSGDAVEPAQMIGGDLNTMAHGLARLSPRYCGRGWMRLTTLGWSEPQWWAAHVLCGAAAPARLRAWGVADAVAARCVNPGFADPFDIDRDVTVVNHCGCFSGKLDWLFVRGPLEVVNQRMGNADFALSDHMWLLLDVCPRSH